MNRKKLAALVLAGVAASVFGGMTIQAADSSTLDEVVVNADKDKQVRGNESIIKPLGIVADEVQELDCLGIRMLYQHLSAV